MLAALRLVFIAHTWGELRPTCSLASNSSISIYFQSAPRSRCLFSHPDARHSCADRDFFRSLADRPTSSSDVRFTSKVNIEATVRFGSLADILHCNWHVRFTPETGHVRCTRRCLLCANSGHRLGYSITSSARASSERGTVRPSALAVFILSTVSYSDRTLRAARRRFP